MFARTIPAGLDFGSQNVNTASAAQDATLTNIGNQPLNFSVIAPPTGFNFERAGYFVLHRFRAQHRTRLHSRNRL